MKITEMTTREQRLNFAPRPWQLVDNSRNDHPFVEIRAPGRSQVVAYKYAPKPHEVADFAAIVEAVNAHHFSDRTDHNLTNF